MGKSKQRRIRKQQLRLQQAQPSQSRKDVFFYEASIPKGMLLMQYGRPSLSDMTVMEYGKQQYREQGRGYLEFRGLWQECVYIPESYVLKVLEDARLGKEADSYFVDNSQLITKALANYNPEEEIVFCFPKFFCEHPNHSTAFSFGIVVPGDVRSGWCVGRVQNFQKEGFQCCRSNEIVGSAAYWLVSTEDYERYTR